MDLSQSAVTFVLSALGALVAGYTGVWFGLARMRRERAFDRRLDWYLRMIATMQEIASKGMLLPYAIDLAKRRSLSQQVTDATARFSQLASEARMYVSRRADAALIQILDQLDSLVPDLSGQDTPAAERAHYASIALMNHGVEVLTADVRRELGLSALPPRPSSKASLPPYPTVAFDDAPPPDAG